MTTREDGLLKIASRDRDSIIAGIDRMVSSVITKRESGPKIDMIKEYLLLIHVLRSGGDEDALTISEMSCMLAAMIQREADRRE